MLYYLAALDTMVDNRFDRPIIQIILIGNILIVGRLLSLKHPLTL